MKERERALCYGLVWSGLDGYPLLDTTTDDTLLPLLQSGAGRKSCWVRRALNRNPFGSIQYTGGRIGRDFLGFSQIQMN